jgi:hypothetical protein
MPTFTRIEYIHAEFSPGDLSYLDITMHDVLPGPLSLSIELDPNLPHAFVVAGKKIKKISRRRKVPTGSEIFSTRIAFRVSDSVATTADPIVTITASGVDGTGLPYRLALNAGTKC